MNAPNVADLVEAGHDFLKSFTAKVRHQGEHTYHIGAVRSLDWHESDLTFVAKVAGSRGDPYQVQLVYEGSLGLDGWDAECSCDRVFDCKHAYAAMKRALARLAGEPEHVRPDPGISPTLAGRAAPPAPPSGKETMKQRLRRVLGRDLQSDEAAYIQQIEQNFFECRKRGAFMAWNATDLGFKPPGQSWDRLDIWPSPPKDVFEFWNHVAYAATHQWGGTFPDFLDPVTDFGSMESSVQAWRRAQVVDRWTRWMNKFDEEIRSDVAGEVDLRVRMLEDGVSFEIRDEFRDQFRPLKPTPCRQLFQRVLDGQVNFTTEAVLIWAILAPRLTYGGDPGLSYDEPRSVPLIHRLLTTPALHGRILNGAGTPYRFAPERLRWLVREAPDPAGDYGFRLVQHDGSPLPPVVAMFTGRSVAVVTDDTVFFGPALPADFDLASGELTIPAIAVEQPAGVAFLRGLEVDLPPRVRERLEIVPVQPKITCELGPSQFGGSSEYCRVRLTAASADGVIEESWNGAAWVQQRAYKLRTQDQVPDKIVSYDRSALAGMAEALGSLSLRWHPDFEHGEVRVTRKFPEEFAAWRRSLPEGVELELRGELASLGCDEIAGSVKLNVAEAGIDWFDLTVVLNLSETDLSQEEIKLLLNARGGYVRLEDKGWRRLRFDLSTEEDERLARLGLNPRELTSEPQRLHVLQLADAAARRFLPEEQFDRVHRRAAELQARVTPDIPAGIRAELRPYQRDGFHFLCYLSTNRFGGILADDMGLGKTLQTLTWLAWLRERVSADAAANGSGDGGGRRPRRAKPGPVLVVCPKSVMDNWERETERFLPELRTRRWAASELDRLPQEITSADLHVLNYSQLRIVGESLAAVRWLAVILDEGQYIKNPDSQTAQVARTLQAEHRLILSGTPIENRLMDLWSLMTFAMPGVLGSRAQFTRMFGAREDTLARRRLAARVRPFLLRRTKSQVAKDLPDRIEEDLLCDMEGDQKALYRAELKVAQQILLKVQTAKELAEERFNFLTSLLRLRQICCDPRLIKPDSTATSAKVEALLEQLEPLMDEGQKVLVFSQFVTMLDLLREPLEERGWPVFYLAGDTENRGELVETFQTAPGPGVFLISLKAGGFGLNLTAAGYVVIFDPWWNPAVENQAIDRTHRIGQKQNVIAYRLLMKNSIEEKIRALQKQKRALVEDVLGEEKFGQNLTLDDLRFLVSD